MPPAPRRSTRPSGPRDSADPLRPQRGGIQKRRARTDNDGDLVMDAEGGAKRVRSTRARPSALDRPTRVHGAIPRGARQAGRAPRELIKLSQLRVHGLKDSKAASNPDGGLQDLLSFLERKATGHRDDGKEVRVKKSRIDGDWVIISVSEADAQAILTLNNFKFASATLKIEEFAGQDVSPPKGQVSEETQVLKDRLKGILGRRYDGAAKLLNLSDLRQDPELIELGMFDHQQRITKLFPALMAVCNGIFTSLKAKREAILSITLSDNGLENVIHVTALAQTFPELQNLDISRNSFTLGGLRGWRWKFRFLENLIVDQTLADSDGSELVRWYPTLRTLNGIQIRSDAEVTAALEEQSALKKGTCPIPVRGPDFRDVSGVGEGFIKEFFVLYDSDRAALARKFYDSTSVYSLAVNVSAPRADLPDMPPPTWGAYIKSSRNLVKVNHFTARKNRECHGVDSIVALWNSLPATRHPDIVKQNRKYMVDCKAVQGLEDPNNPTKNVDGLIIDIHGVFEDKDPNSDQTYLRSFSRNFVLGPGPVGGLHIRVVSDILVLRAYGPVAQPKKQPQLQAPVNSAQPANALQPVNNMLPANPLAPATQMPLNPTPTEDQIKEGIARQLIAQTNMTVQYAALCLSQSDWDLAKAMVAFEANKAKLPADAFNPPGTVI